MINTATAPTGKSLYALITDAAGHYFRTAAHTFDAMSSQTYPALSPVHWHCTLGHPVQLSVVDLPPDVSDPLVLPTQSPLTVPFAQDAGQAGKIIQVRS